MYLPFNPGGQNIWQGVLYVKPDQFHEYKAWWRSTGKLIAPHEWGIARALKNKEESFEEEIECFDGTHKIIMNWAVPFIDDDGNIKGVIAVNQDVTERTRLADERERLIEELQTALNEVKTLRKILPICSHCKKIAMMKGTGSK
ncbi:hypothetical protein JW960_06130 [candidate division KSB1 bacterium]|nr:hypothetical protein [candidate division KSB1 bacterium]